MRNGCESMIDNFERVILLTGAASGIGAATARLLARPGTALLLHTRRNAEGLESVAAETRECGAVVELVLADLAEADAPKILVETIKDRFGRLDQIVSNAGFADKRRFGDVDAAALRTSLAAITEAFFGLVTEALPQLEASKWGRVVAVSSFVAHSFGANDTIFPVSAAAKSGLESLAKALAYQLAPSGTTVNCVSPGIIDSDMTMNIAEKVKLYLTSRIPMGKLGTGEDVSNCVAFLSSEQASYVTGETVHVNGGMYMS